MITGVKKINTKKGDSMAFLTLEDLTGTVEVVVFPRVYLQSQLAIRKDEVVLVKGRCSGNGEDVKIIGEEISTLDCHLGGELHLKIDSLHSPLLDQVQVILSNFRGGCPVYLHFVKERRVIKTGEEFWVDLSGPVVGRLEELLGSSGVKIKRISEMPGDGTDGSASSTVPPKTVNQQPLECDSKSLQEIPVAAKASNSTVAVDSREKGVKKAKKFFSILEL